MSRNVESRRCPSNSRQNTTGWLSRNAGQEQAGGLEGDKEPEEEEEKEEEEEEADEPSAPAYRNMLTSTARAAVSAGVPLVFPLVLVLVLAPGRREEEVVVVVGPLSELLRMAWREERLER